MSGSTAVWESKIGWQLCASRVLRERRVLALDQPSSQGVDGLGLIAESRQSHVRGVVLSREPPKLQHVGLCLYQSLIGILFVVCETVTHLRRCGGTRLVPREQVIKLYVVSNLS